jgi:hypothetical protein
VLAVPWNPVLGALLGYIGIFAPGILLKLALLPLYKDWREYAIAKSALRGLNAAAVGLIYTAVWQLFLGELGSCTTSGKASVDLTCTSSIHSRTHLHVGRGNDDVDGERCSHCGSLVGRRSGCQFRGDTVVSLATSRFGSERSDRRLDLVRCDEELNWNRWSCTSSVRINADEQEQGCASYNVLLGIQLWHLTGLNSRLFQVALVEEVADQRGLIEYPVPYRSEGFGYHVEHLGERLSKLDVVVDVFEAFVFELW